MVPLDKRGEYLGRILENDKFLIFYNFIVSSGTTLGDKSEALSEVIDEDFVGILKSICNSDSKEFDRYYAKYSTRIPSTTSPFVNDDYLVFSLIIGVKKFSREKAWILSVVNARKCTSEDCNQSLITFKNILIENYNSLDNHFGLVLICQSILKNDLLIPANKAGFFKKITSAVFPSKKSDFLNIIELCSFDFLISEQLLSSDGEYQKYRDIVNHVEVRIFQLSTLIFYLMCSVVVVAVVWSYFKNENIKELVQSFEAIFGFLGLPGVIVMIFNREEIIHYFVHHLRIFLGGNPMILNKK